jgi:hypothetical protein
MAQSAGTRLGPYEILAPLEAGGISGRSSVAGAQVLMRSRTPAEPGAAALPADLMIANQQRL